MPPHWYCGSKEEAPNGRVHGTEIQCSASRQLRLYGLQRAGMYDVAETSSVRRVIDSDAGDYCGGKPDVPGRVHAVANWCRQKGQVRLFGRIALKPGSNSPMSSANGNGNRNAEDVNNRSGASSAKNKSRNSPVASTGSSMSSVVRNNNNSGNNSSERLFNNEPVVQPPQPKSGRTRKRQVNDAAVVGDGVKVLPTAHMGLGLFAMWQFSKGDIITEYAGKGVTVEEAKSKRVQTHIARAGGSYVYGLRRPVVGKGGGSFANHDAKPNAFLIEVGNKLYLKASQEIAPEAEITISYGKEGSLAKKVAMGTAKFKNPLQKNNINRTGSDNSVSYEQENAIRQTRSQMAAPKHRAIGPADGRAARSTLPRSTTASAANNDVSQARRRSTRVRASDYAFQTRTFERHVVKGDGNCLFNAFAHQLAKLNIRYTPAELRQKAVDRMRKDVRFKQGWHADPSVKKITDFKAYLAFMTMPGKAKNASTWGDSYCLTALASIFRMRVLIFYAGTSQQTEIEPMTLLRGESAGLSEISTDATIFLVFSEGNHYDSTNEKL